MDTCSCFMQMMLMMWMVLVLLLPSTIAQRMCENCNCAISTTGANSQTIYNMGLSCDTGIITWYGASGGILLELSPFIYGNFRACFVVESDEYTFVKFSRENSQVVVRSNYRRRRRDVRRSRLDHVSTSAGRSKEFCVESTSREPVMLYIEAERTSGVGAASKVLIHYDMERLYPTSSHGDIRHLDECRPCTKQEILDAYCSMDFVVVGNMLEVQDNTARDKTEISLGVKQIIYTSKPDHFRRIKRSDAHLTGHVVTPLKCGVRMGKGDFLFTGRMRLGHMSLKCSPYLHEWRQIQKEAECTRS